MVLPGQTNTTVDFDQLQLVVYDLRNNQELYRKLLHLCGDGQHNEVLEECDYARKPPAGDYVYPGRDDLFYDQGMFYSCSSLCTKVPFDGLCGDSIESNGPLKLAQIEQCDDGNTESGDGCSADCKQVEPGYQCKEWGKPCEKMCGNGKVDQAYIVGFDSDNMPIYFQEECDLGPLNSD